MRGDPPRWLGPALRQPSARGRRAGRRSRSWIWCTTRWACACLARSLPRSYSSSSLRGRESRTLGRCACGAAFGSPDARHLASLPCGVERAAWRSPGPGRRASSACTWEICRGRCLRPAMTARIGRRAASSASTRGRVRRGRIGAGQSRDRARKHADRNQIRELRGRLPLPLDHALLATLRDPGQPPCVGRCCTSIPPWRWPAGRAGGAISTRWSSRCRGSHRAAQALSRAGQLAAEGLVNEAGSAGSARGRVTAGGGHQPDDAQPGPAGRRKPSLASSYPDVRELRIAEEERSDPIGDAVHAVQPGLIHRYHDRALLADAPVLGVLPLLFSPATWSAIPRPPRSPLSALAAAIATIAERPQIWEVIDGRRSAGAGGLAHRVALVGAARHSARAHHSHSQPRPAGRTERIGPSLIRALRGPKPAYVVAAHHAASGSLAERRPVPR